MAGNSCNGTRQPRPAEGFVRLFCPEAKVLSPISLAGEVIALSDSEDDTSQADCTDIPSASALCLEEGLATSLQSEGAAILGDLGDVEESLPAEGDGFAYLDAFAFGGRLAEPKPLYLPANCNVAVSEKQVAAIASGVNPGKRHQQEEIVVQKRKRTEPLEDFDAMTTADHERIRRKWWNFVEGAPDNECEKVQLLIAAILHAKASEVAVQRSLQKLRKWAEESEGECGSDSRCLTWTSLACASVTDLEHHLEGLHWHKTKAIRIVAAAKEILKLYDGRVPVDKASLLGVPGIGPKLANVVNFVLNEGRVLEA